MMGSNDDKNKSTIPSIMVFRPTLDEMKDFSKYIAYMESLGAHKAGLAKIIPPKEYVPRKAGYDDLDVMIKAPIQQVVTGGQGLFQQYNIQKKSMHVKQFKKLAESSKYMTPEHDDYEELERKYWKNISYNPAIYGADISGTITDPECQEFNINKLNTILDLINEDYGIKIMGVNTAYLYFGMWKTTFAWHTEDMDLYSINYLHFGAPKSWYTIPPEHGRRLERLAAGFFPDSQKKCPAFLRHKMTLISPAVLKKYSIPYNKITQEKGEFMITFPYAYHAGYNHGYNCAESTNFALERWVEFGKRALRCTCRADSVKISMEAFVKKFQPERYELWLAGKDVGPDPKDPKMVCAAPAPSTYELTVMSTIGVKSKRHPPHKIKIEGSDTEDNVSDDCSEMCTPPVKTARKMSDSSEPKQISFKLLDDDSQFRGDDVNETIKRIQEQINVKHKDKEKPEKEKKKRKKEKEKSSNPVPPHLVGHSYAKPSEEYRETTSRCMQPLRSSQHLFGSSLLPKIPIKTISHSSFSDSIHSDDSKSNDGSLKLMKPWKFSDSDSKNSSVNSSPNNGFRGLQLLASKTKPSAFSTQSPSGGQSTQASPTINFSQHSLSQPSKSYPQQSSTNNAISNDLSPATVEPPLIRPYFEYSPSKTSSPPVLNPLDLPLTPPTLQDFSQNARSNWTTPPQLSPAIINGQQLNEIPGLPKLERMVEASTSTEDPILKRKRSPKKLEVVDNEMLMKQLTKNTHQFAPKGITDEIQLNLCMSTVAPHCAICLLLKPFKLDKAMLKRQLTHYSPPKNSDILIPGVAFTSKVKDESTVFDINNNSPLLVCKDCRICVHSSCYGVVDVLFDGSERNWKCDRCAAAKDCAEEYFATCVLCPLRGGPLKKTTEGTWAHLICALMIEDVKFVNGLTKSPIDISEVKPETPRLEGKPVGCLHCQKANKDEDETNSLVEYLSGYFIYCNTSGSHGHPFHVMCAYRQGAEFKSSDWPKPIIVKCKKCVDADAAKRKQIMERNLIEVDVGTDVIAKHKNRRFYHAKIVDKIDQVFHHVHFVDNSFTKLLKTSEFISHDFESNHPEEGDMVEVIFNKDHLCGRYSGNHTCKVYTILFDDDSQIKTQRDEFYLPTDDLPKKVLIKMSNTTAF